MESVRQVTYYKVMVPNKAGAGARFLDGLKNSGVNLLAFSGFPVGKKAQLDFIPEDPAAFERTAKQAGIKISAGKPVFLVQGEDRVGALAEILPNWPPPKSTSPPWTAFRPEWANTAPSSGSSPKTQPLPPARWGRFKPFGVVRIGPGLFNFQNANGLRGRWRSFLDK
jgi:hypothetical protein